MLVGPIVAYACFVLLPMHAVVWHTLQSHRMACLFWAVLVAVKPRGRPENAQTLLHTYQLKFLKGRSPYSTPQLPSTKFHKAPQPVRGQCGTRCGQRKGWDSSGEGGKGKRQLGLEKGMAIVSVVALTPSRDPRSGSDPKRLVS